MNNKKAKEKWMKQQETNKKTCLNCTQLCKDKSGQYLCKFAANRIEAMRGGGVIITVEQARHIHPLCFDKWNGKNLLNP